MSDDHARYIPLSTPFRGASGWICNVQDRFTREVLVAKYASAGTSQARALEQEARYHQDLDHPGLSRFAGWIRPESGIRGIRPSIGLVTRWIDGAPLQGWGADRSHSERIEAVAQLLAPVHYLHRRGLLHLDIKPANALVDVTTRRVILIDLGSARPNHEGPGEIGGTWGFAAPELTRREAPSEAADAYSIGVVLYHMLAGRSPWPDGGHSDPTPLRAVAPTVRPEVATLVMQLLGSRAAERATVTEIAASLSELGYAVPAFDLGLQPLLGREESLRDLRSLMGTSPRPVAVVGRPGIGRRRLTRAMLQTLRDSTDPVDLSRSMDLSGCLERIDGERWVFVGDLDQLPPRTLERVRAAHADPVRCIGISTSIPEGFAGFPVGPLREADLLDLASFAGRRLDSTVRSMARAAAGRPGAMLSALGVSAARAVVGDAARALDALRTLPPGTTVEPFRALPAVGPHLDLLGHYGLVRVVDGTLYVTPSERGDPEGLDPRLAPGLEALVDRGDSGSDPAWRALSLVLLGRTDEAIAALPGAPDRPGPPTRALWRLYRALAGAGREAGHRGLARVALADGRPDQALAALEALPQLEPSDHAIRVTALRARGDLDAALRAARDAVERCPHPQTWCILGSARLLTGDPAGAERAAREAEALDTDGAWEDRIFGLRLSLALAAARGGELIDSAMIARAQDKLGAMGLSIADLSRAGRAALRYGDVNAAVALLGRATEEASAQGDLRASAYAWLHLGNAELRRGAGDRARVALAQAIRAARAAPAPEVLVRALYASTELELRSGRLPAAERNLRAFDAQTLSSRDPEALQRSALLRAALEVERQSFGAALQALSAVTWEGAPTDVACARTLLEASALIELDRPQQALEALEALAGPATDRDRRQLEMLEGRAHLRIGRELLARAARDLPPPGPRMDRQIGARIAAAHAGEDLDPASFAWRREALDRAAALLTGPEAVRAADLRDRLLSGPGAQLDGMVDLIETVQDPARFPAALAALVREALGANRVLIMVRIPGLGRQTTFSELTDREAAGLSVEILKRIQGPDDVWLADNAVADPHLRSISATVRTLSIRSVVAVAIPQGERALGALYVDDVHRANRFQPEHVALLKRLAAAAAALLPLLSPAAVPAREPRELHGVYLSDERRVRETRSVLDRLRSQPQGNLLISGATGTGKTWLARRIATDVLGLEGLVEATMRRTEIDRLVGLFAGTRRGDFTGAVDQIGLLRRCQLENAALFIDEVHALDEDAQVALLPLLELPKRRFAGLSTSSILLERPLTVLLGTNIALRSWRQHFREDFWFRIGGLQVHLPTLAERGPEVVYQYLRTMLRRHGAPEPEEVLDPGALSLLTHHDWPGNLRDLEQVVDRLAFEWQRHEHRVAEHEIAHWLGSHAPESARPRTPDQAFLDEVLERLPTHGWNQTVVARELGTTPSRINRALKRAGLLDAVRRNKATSG